MNRLIRGVLLFITFGTLLLFLVTGMEYLFWLSSMLRMVLFATIVVAWILLSYLYIIKPVLYLTRLRKGINQEEASHLIGQHFPDIGDRLSNLIQLSQSNIKTELLMAAIQQRSNDLNPLPFNEAIDLKKSWFYGRYLVIPFIFLLFILISGSFKDFFSSYTRVINYDLAYEPPAPFHFLIENETLRIREDTPLVIKVKTIGDIIPQSVFITLNGESMLMRNVGSGQYEWTIEPPIKTQDFRLMANNVVSKTYDIEAIQVPLITNFKMIMSYPKYLEMINETISGTGNAEVPEGTKITWKLETENTSKVLYHTEKESILFNKEANEYVHRLRATNSIDYELATSNDEINRYEQLGYQIKVIKDKFPQIKVVQVKDSLNPNEIYFFGKVSDDKKVDSVNLIYKKVGIQDRNIRSLIKPNTNVSDFYYTFPSGIEVEEGAVYEIYFEVWDNDGLRGGKKSSSQVFSTKILDNFELVQEQLINQKAIINELDKGVESIEKQDDELKEINAQQKTESDLMYKDKERIRHFLDKQQQQEQLMEKFTKRLKENLENKPESDEQNELLKERLERQEMQAKKNQRALEELEKIAEKINKADLTKRLDELAKTQAANKRNLQQLVELAKRYYVTEKATQLAEQLDAISERQKELSKSTVKNDSSLAEQRKMNKNFDQLAKELNELQSDNRALRKPLELNFNTNQEESIKRDQEDALKGLEETESNKSKEKTPDNQLIKVKQKQRSASDKIKELAEGLMQSSMSGVGSETLEEDAEMLRQILDNLITFSFKQEDLLERVDGMVDDMNAFSTIIREQQKLRTLFEHVDDSLFALSLRKVEIAEFVNQEISEVYYNVDKALEVIADNQVFQGLSYQQYVLNASNKLAVYLAEVLENIQMSMSSSQGNGSTSDFQLPDIIKKQQELQEKMSGNSSGKSAGEQGEKKSEGNEDGKGNKNSGESRESEEGNKSQQSTGKGKGQGTKNSEDDRIEAKGKDKKKGKNKKAGGATGGSANGDGSGGNEELSESELQEIYEIYQQQQTIRKELERQLNTQIRKEKQGLGKRLIQQMEELENELLEHGITQRTLNKANNIRHELLKLENAVREQGKKRERESKFNRKAYSAPIITKPEYLKDKESQVEILNRQALPLRQSYQNKVKDYFGKDGAL